MPKQQDSLHLRLAAGKTLDSNESKSRLLEMIAKGFSVEDACKAVGKSSKTFYYYTKSDPDFDREVKLYQLILREKIDTLYCKLSFKFFDYSSKKM